jgi:hypothetical protein
MQSEKLFKYLDNLENSLEEIQKGEPCSYDLIGYYHEKIHNLLANSSCTLRTFKKYAKQWGKIMRMETVLIENTKDRFLFEILLSFIEDPTVIWMIASEEKQHRFYETTLIMENIQNLILKYIEPKEDFMKINGDRYRSFPFKLFYQHGLCIYTFMDLLGGHNLKFNENFDLLALFKLVLSEGQTGYLSDMKSHFPQVYDDNMTELAENAKKIKDKNMYDFIRKDIEKKVWGKNTKKEEEPKKEEDISKKMEQEMDDIWYGQEEVETGEEELDLDLEADLITEMEEAWE